MIKKGLILLILVITALAFAACAPAAPATPDEDPDAAAEIDQSQYIFDLFRGEETSAEDGEKIILALGDIDWSEYGRISRINEAEPFELLDWLYHQEINGDEQIRSLQQGTRGLDGAYADIYSSILTRVFLADQMKFLSLLEGLNEKQISDVVHLVAYGCWQEPEQIKADLVTLIEAGDLDAAAKAAAEELLETLENYYPQ